MFDKRIIPVLGIISLFFFSSVVPISIGYDVKTSNFIEQPITFNNLGTTYVDDDNTEGPWDGTQEHPYQFIQDGLNASLEGGTVFVYDGVCIMEV